VSVTWDEVTDTWSGGNFCAHCNEHSGSMISGEFLEHMRY
jgi:hypothetical protein